MTTKEQALVFFLQFLQARRSTPWIARRFEEMADEADAYQSPRNCLQRMGGMASTWYEPHHISGPWDNKP